jgi:hypothetical protein
MALPTNDDFANRELSIEELETMAAGGFWSTLETSAKTSSLLSESQGRSLR